MTSLASEYIKSLNLMMNNDSFVAIEYDTNESFKCLTQENVSDAIFWMKEEGGIDKFLIEDNVNGDEMLYRLTFTSPGTDNHPMSPLLLAVLGKKLIRGRSFVIKGWGV